MKGNCIPLNVVIHPYALIIQTAVLAGTTVKKLLTVRTYLIFNITDCFFFNAKCSYMLRNKNVMKITVLKI